MPESVLPLLLDLVRAGVRLSVHGADGLAWDAPPGTASPELLARVGAARPALVRLLATPAGGPLPYATCDQEAAAGLPAYGPADDRLPDRRSAREAGLDALIVAYAARRRVEHWVQRAAAHPLDPTILACVRRDLEAAVSALVAAPAPVAPGRPATQAPPPGLANAPGGPGQGRDEVWG